jgi:hypothetical protein
MDAFERVPVFPPVTLSSLLWRNFPTFTLIFMGELWRHVCIYRGIGSRGSYGILLWFTLFFWASAKGVWFGHHGKVWSLLFYLFFSTRIYVYYMCLSDSCVTCVPILSLCDLKRLSELLMGWATPVYKHPRLYYDMEDIPRNSSRGTLIVLIYGNWTAPKPCFLTQILLATHLPIGAWNGCSSDLWLIWLNRHLSHIHGCLILI